jgi:osmoprotectant transport system ATP-binding protein
VEIVSVPTLSESGIAEERGIECSEQWRLVLDSEKRPRGWLAPKSTKDILPGGSLYVLGTAMRGALDAALSSPSGQGVVIDDSGRFAGVVDGRQILEVIEHRHE